MTGESVAGQVYEAIRNEIITCRLRPSQQIAQPQLAEKYQTGTTPVREALQRLAQEGLVQPIPRFGYLVTGITLSDVTGMYELRSILESAAARLAALRGPQDQLDNILVLADSPHPFTDRESYSRFLAHNKHFHRSVAVATGNQKLVEAIARLFDEMTRFYHLRLDPSDSDEEMRAEHRTLAEALRGRDPDNAERIVLDQIARSQRRVRDALLSGGDDGIGPLGQMVRLGPS